MKLSHLIKQLVKIHAETEHDPDVEICFGNPLGVTEFKDIEWIGLAGAHGKTGVQIGVLDEN